MPPAFAAISSRPATEADLPFLMSLRGATMGPHLLAAGIAQDEPAMLDRILNEFGSARIVEATAEPIGLIKVVKGEYLWSLHQIQLLPQWQGRGIGTELLREVLVQASRVGARVELHVLKVNKARRLYERLGFKVVTEAANAFVMQTEA